MPDEIYTFCTLRSSRNQSRIELSLREARADMDSSHHGISGYQTIGTSPEALHLGEVANARIGLFRILFNPDTIPFTSLTIASGSATFTTAAAHGLSPGDPILIALRQGSNPPSALLPLAGRRTVATTTATQFTITGIPGAYGPDDASSFLRILSDREHWIELSRHSDGSTPFVRLRHSALDTKLAFSAALIPLASGTLYARADGSPRTLEYFILEGSI